MKKLGKALLGLVAAVAMLFTGLVAPTTALADVTPATTITIKDVYSGDKYEGWRLLNVTQSADGTNTAYQLNDKYAGTLKDVINAAVPNTVTATSGEELRSQIVNYISKLDTDGVRTFANAVWAKVWDATNNKANTGLESDVSATATQDGDLTINNAASGYYLLAQTENGKTGTGTEDGKAYSLVMLDTKGLANVDVTSKKNIPTFEKKVMDKNDSDNEGKGSESGWQDSADYDVNDTVPFQFTGTMPSDIDEYDTYKYVFHDSMSKGLTFNKDSIKVYLNSVSDINLIDTSSYSVVETDSSPALDDNDGTNFTITFTDLKTATINGTTITLNKDSKIIVQYNGTLNGNALIGATGNPNYAYLEYENNPNDEGKGTSRTKTDKVIVFTYEVDINKVDNNKRPLAGATFKLEKYYTKDGESAPAWHEVGTIQTSLSDGKYVSAFQRVDDGKYRLTETVVPDGYSGIDPIEFTITATHEETSDDPKLQTITINGLTGAQGNTTSGIVSATIENKPGSELPSTGGMGTVVLYALGGAFVVAAGLWFGLRRRFSNR
ncbi:isopeptide-forming domain-containing fimbrial protein [Bifidobacterium amazonense]|uniref:Isopeptide-forming domain-containing fimbrial protein n=1 Tax=Bifidobacterium amazonense TaxID=2809027 RepID=A0ABS9VWI1_9BIFI|nr:isopeptide-forming domain-containing fimbrial protein [Bifidobacterium amazonense]MCH9276444.1 isopeptide-forming domain-containing fimbrial protein [Bifidobacterium amazonense]